MTVKGASADFPEKLEAAVRDRLGGAVEWSLNETDDGYRIALPDREIVASPRDGPADSVWWTVALHSDGKIVSKCGPYETVDALLDQVQTIVTADVQYTVCCDG